MLSSVALLLPLALMGQDLSVKADEKGKLGYFDIHNNEVIKCKYDEAGEFVNGVARVRIDDEYGLINPEGKFVTEKYTIMEDYADTDLYIVAEGGSMKPGNTISSRQSIPKATFKGSCEYPLDGGKWGLIDRKGNVVVSPKYNELSNPIDGVIYIIKGGKVGFLDKNFNEVVEPTYNFMGLFNSHGWCWVMKGGKIVNRFAVGGKMGIMKRDGSMLIPAENELVCTFPLPKDSLYSSEPIMGVDLGVTLSPFVPMTNYDDVPYFWYKSDKKKSAGLMDANGNIILPDDKYTMILKPTDGMARFCVAQGKGKKTKYLWGFYDISQKKEIYTDTAFYYLPFHDGSSLVIKKDKSDNFLVDKNMQEISSHYSVAYNFHEGYCVVKRNDKWGAIDRKGKEVVPLQYIDVKAKFSEGLLGAKDAGVGKWGMVNCNGDCVIPFEYDDLGFCEKSMIVVKVDEKYGIIDKRGVIVLPAKWNNFIYDKQERPNYFWVQRDDSLYYFYDIGISQVTFPSNGKGFEAACLFSERGYATVMKDSLYGAVRRNGAEFIPLTFKSADDVDKAYLYMLKNGIKKFRNVDLERCKIILRGTSNSYKLSDTIPAIEWDF